MEKHGGDNGPEGGGTHEVPDPFVTAVRLTPLQIQAEGVVLPSQEKWEHRYVKETDEGIKVKPLPRRFEDCDDRQRAEKRPHTEKEMEDIQVLCSVLPVDLRKEGIQTDGQKAEPGTEEEHETEEDLEPAMEGPDTDEQEDKGEGGEAEDESGPVDLPDKREDDGPEEIPGSVKQDGESHPGHVQLVETRELDQKGAYGAVEQAGIEHTEIGGEFEFPVVWKRTF